MRLFVGDVEVDTDYVVSVIKAVGIKRFRELNPWFDALIPKTPKKRRMTKDQREFKTLLAHHSREVGRDLRENHNWTPKQLSQLFLGQRRFDKRQRRLAKDRKKTAPKGTAWDEARDDAQYRLDHSFKFKGSGKRQPRVRHYEKNIKKKVATPA